MTPLETREAVDDLVRWEGAIPWLYLDTKGLVTVGIGFLVKTVEAALLLPFYDTFTSTGATDGAIRRDFERVARAGQTTGALPRRPAGYYREPNGLRLRDSEMRGLAATKLVTIYVPGIVALLPEFDTYPAPVKRALIDLSWNLGVAGLGKFGNLLACCKDRDWQGAALECSVRTSRPERNAWRAQMFADARENRVA